MKIDYKHFDVFVPILSSRIPINITTIIWHQRSTTTKSLSILASDEHNNSQNIIVTMITVKGKEKTKMMLTKKKSAESCKKQKIPLKL
ncbi:hypothetical protein DERP_005790 [Dermatophagoides pteronyssinus]|uniref:Uncharacterized protein n=1 Tax=Dermatophagoides pteronyssinus TaxID=6956 RepID=A0ABQ8JA65_DERPT|nr:hypothetical protein DERP_005790 [Dermatophagoides pteronyssinus]